jgi:hypothetical protein
MFSFVDGQIMQFIECIHSKLNGISLDIHSLDVQIWQSVEHFGQIHRLFEMMIKKASSIYYEHFFDFLRLHPNAFDLIENVQAIRRNRSSVKWKAIDLLVKWLLIKSSSADRPKFFNISYSIHAKDEKSMLIDKIKEVIKF